MSTDNQSPQSSSSNRLVIILGIIAGAALLGVMILTFFLISDRQEGGAEVNTPPTPFPETVTIDNSTTIVTGVDTGIDGSGSISVTLDAPLELIVGNKAFAVRSEQVPANGEWAPTVSTSNQAVWVFGSIVNYVVGIADNAENRALLENLQAGDEMTMSTQLGTTLTFTFETHQVVSRQNTDVFRQTRPGISIFLVGSEGDERLVVNGRHVVTEADDSFGNVIGLGETAQLEDLQFTVPSVAYVPERPEVPPGFAFFQVDYDVQNVGLTAFDTSVLEFTLVDSVGNRYALNPVASQVGNFPALSGFVNSGAIMQATAGYQIPIGLSSDALSWVVTKVDSGSQLQVTIPFTSNPVTGSQSTQISLNRAEVGSDLTTLILGGQITNLNTQPIVVTDEDIELLGADGAGYLLLSTNPPLPWSVGAGEAFQFNLIYQPPVTDTAVFTIFNQSFQLAGFR
ncbi:MAG: DUF4352 domain-containing protein [Chloroflexota bacterium]